MGPGRPVAWAIAEDLYREIAVVASKHAFSELKTDILIDVVSEMLVDEPETVMECVFSDRGMVFRVKDSFRRALVNAACTVRGHGD